MNNDQQEYRLDKVSIKDVTTEIDRIWQQLQQPDSGFADEAISEGVDPASLKQLKGYSRADVLVLENGGGLGVEAVALIVAFAPVAAKITKDLWDNFILPRLKERFGENGIERDENDK